MVCKNLYSDKLDSILQQLDKTSNEILNLERIITLFLKCSQNGGAYDCEHEKKTINAITNEIIKRIRNSRIVPNMDDPIFSLILNCKKMAIEGVKLSDDEILFTSQVAELYLKIKERKFYATSTFAPAITELSEIRNRVLQEGHRTSDSVSKMFDFVDMAFIKDNVIRRTKRFESGNRSFKSYCSTDDEKEKKIRMMEDLKPYIHSFQYEKTLLSCLFKFDSRDIKFYIQAFLMLEYGVSFSKTYNILNQFFSDEKFEEAIRELAIYSKNGIEFYKYVKKRKSKNLSQEDKYILESADIEIRISKAYGKVLTPSEKEKNIYDKPYEEETFKSRKEEDDYISLHTICFDLPRLLLRDESNKGIVLLTEDDHFAINSLKEPKKAIIKLEEFIDMKLSQNSNLQDDYIDIFKEDFGYDIIIITNDSGKLTIETHISQVMSDKQREYLNGICRQLSYVSRVMKLRSDYPNRDSNIEEIKKCIGKIKQNTRALDKKFFGKKLIPKLFKNYNPQ